MKVLISNILDKLEHADFEAYMVDRYPFILKHNLTYSNNHLRSQMFQIVTNAKLNELKKLFPKYKLNNDFFNSFELKILDEKNNYIYIKIFYCGTFISKLDNTSINLNSIEDIQKQFPFILNGLILKNKRIINYETLKNDAFNNVLLKEIHENDNFKNILLNDPIYMLHAIELVANTNYTLSPKLFKIIKSNIKLLKHLSIEDVYSQLIAILQARYASAGIKLLKQLNLEKIKIEGEYLFDFLEFISDVQVDTFNIINNIKNKFVLSPIELWTQLLKDIDKDKIKNILSKFKVNEATQNKIIWIINNYNIINEEDYKKAIYKACTEMTKPNIYTLHQEIYALYHIYINSGIDPNKCQLLLDALCSRPYFTEQVVYTDEQMCKIADEPVGEWVNKIKKQLILNILDCKSHPNPEQYLQLMINLMSKELNKEIEMPKLGEQDEQYKNYRC